MAVNDPTTNYSWDLPADAAATDTWGTTLNEAIGDVAGSIESIDEVLADLQTLIDAEEARATTVTERVERLESVAPRPAYARVYSNVDIVVAKAVAEDIVWSTEVFDVGDMFDVATQPTRLTIPTNRDGLFTIRGYLKVPAWTGSGDDASSWLLRIVKNGSTEVAISRYTYHNDSYSAKSGDRTISVEALDNAVATDYYELEVTYDYNDTGVATQSVSGSIMESYFEIYRHWSPVQQLQPAAADLIYSTNSSTTTHSVSLPASGRVPGQALIVCFFPRANVTLISEPSGYSKIYDSGAESAVTDAFVYYRRITATEAGGGTIGWETNLSRTSVGVAFLVNDMDVANNPEAGGDDANCIVVNECLNAPSLTPTWGPQETLWIIAFGEGGPGADTEYTGVPSGFTATDVVAKDPDRVKTGTTSGDIACGAATKDSANATEDPDGFQHSVNASGLTVIIAVPGASIT